MPSYEDDRMSDVDLGYVLLAVRLMDLALRVVELRRRSRKPSSPEPLH
jgi:hypothetical protein